MPLRRLFKQHFVLKLSMLLCGMMAASPPAQSSELLRFAEPEAAFKAVLFLSGDRHGVSKDSHLFAKIDLNADGAPEYIAKEKSCAGFCDYKVLAQQGRGGQGGAATIVMLGEFHAKDILIGNGYTHGIRNLLVFNNPQNDFRPDLYIWNPGASRYTLGQAKAVGGKT